MQEPLISIIIPIYRMGDLLERAILSIEKQTFTIPFEVLLVIWESDDNSMDICQKWVKKNPDRYRILPCEKPIGHSRLAGVKMSKGKYIYFLDADDELLPHTLETFYKVMEETECDVVNASFYAIRPGGKREKNLFVKEATYDNEGVVNAFLADISFRGFLWCKMFKREVFYRGPLLYLAESRDMFEDTALVTSLLSYCKKVVCITDPLYLYHKDNPRSATSVKRNDRALSHLGVYALQRYFLQKVHPELHHLFFKHILRMKSMLAYDIGLDKKAGCSKEYLAQYRKEKKIVFSEKSELLKEGVSYKPLFERAILPKLEDLE